MNLLYFMRQVSSASAVVAEHIVADPVFFGMQVVRRFPGSLTKSVGRFLEAIPADLSQAVGAWVGGKHAATVGVIERSDARGFSAGVLGELALHMGKPALARELGARAGRQYRRRKLEARALWFEGHMSRAVKVAPPGGMRKRLESELRTFKASWAPFRSRRVGLPKGVYDQPLDVAFLLNNSLPFTQSGYTIRSHETLKALKANGIRVAAMTRTGYPALIGQWSTEPTQLVDDIPYVRHIPWQLGRTPEERLEQQIDFLEAWVRATGASVLHTTTHFVNGLVAREVARRTGVSWVYEVRGILEDTWAASRSCGFQEARETEKYQQFSRAENTAADKADHVVTLGKSMVEHLRSRGVRNNQLTVVPNAIGDSVLDGYLDLAPSQVRRLMGLPTGGFWVGSVASVVNYEGLESLVDTVALLRSQGYDIRLLIVGDGVALPALKERAQVLSEFAVFPGRALHEDAVKFVQCLDCYCIPRTDDPVCRTVAPLKPIEALGLARPLIVSNLPGLTADFPPGSFMAVSPNNPVALAEAVRDLAENGEKRERMRALGRQWVLSNAKWSIVGRRYLDIYEQLGMRITIPGENHYVS